MVENRTPLISSSAMRSVYRAVAIVLPVVLACPSSLAAKQSAPPVATQAAGSGFSAERLSRIDSMLNQLVADRKIPGAVAMLVRDGRVVYHKAFGYRDVDSKVALRTDDIFRIASQTKAITSLAAMMLWEEGRFGLDDSISAYLPEFKNQTVLTKFNPADSSYESKPVKRPTTIRQLFTHSSGLDYADIGSDDFRAIYAKAGLSALGREGDVLADKIRVLGKLPLAFEPGERFNYSLSIDVLGRLVEVVSGIPLDRFFRTRVFEPLKMRDTWFGLPADRVAHLVPLHQEIEGKVEVMKSTEGGMRPDFPARPVTYFSGGGGLSSTTSDYARFLQLFLNGGTLDGVRLVSRKTVELMLTNQIPKLQPPFGLGFALQTQQNDYMSVVTEGTFEWGGAFATTYWADPKEHLVALVYTNVLGSTVGIGEKFKVLVYSAMR
ncbi:MAG: serine hydrolase domain-containing protein [Gemmatimonadaceae bacterium]